VVVLWIELSPAFFEQWRENGPPLLRGLSRTALPIVERWSIAIVALGILLPTMHQSSLGTLMLLAASRLHPLWNTPLLPLLFLISCVSMAYAAVVFENALSSVAFEREPETKMLASLAAVIVPLQIVYVGLRLVDLWWRGHLGLLLETDTRSFMAALEIAVALAPAAMLATRAQRGDLGQLFRAAIVLMFAGAIYRFDTYLVAFTPGSHWAYFPSVPEMGITVGLVAFEVLAYVAIVKMFPILSGRTLR
jgi:Ni/Fe-hydrogenase subunit HybB-like protein